MMANVDFFVEIEGGIYIIECKTSFSYHMDQWEDGKIPRHYELQGRHYMAVTNVQGVIFLCLHGNSEDTFIERRLDRDLDQEEELIEQKPISGITVSRWGSRRHTRNQPIWC